MDKNQLREKIKGIIRNIYKKPTDTTPAQPHIEYDELTKFPELKKVIIDLLTSDFDYFLSTIDWVSPRPTTFRINLKNGSQFYLIYSTRSWIAQVEGKKYYLLNLNEEESACQAISRILRYGVKVEDENTESTEDLSDEAPPKEEPTES